MFGWIPGAGLCPSVGIYPSYYDISQLLGYTELLGYAPRWWAVTPVAGIWPVQACTQVLDYTPLAAFFPGARLYIRNGLYPRYWAVAQVLGYISDI
jgi:hypothetical protein